MSDESKSATPVIHDTTGSTLQLVQSPNFRVIYANGFAYKPSYADLGLTPIVQISITERVDGNLASRNIGLQEVMIMLSLPAAKSLAKNLVRFINQIEKEIGPIKITKQSVVSDEALETVSNELKAVEYE